MYNTSVRRTDRQIYHNNISHLAYISMSKHEKNQKINNENCKCYYPSANNITHMYKVYKKYSAKALGQF